MVPRLDVFDYNNQLFTNVLRRSHEPRRCLGSSRSAHGAACEWPLLARVSVASDQTAEFISNFLEPLEEFHPKAHSAQFPDRAKHGNM